MMMISTRFGYVGLRLFPNCKERNKGEKRVRRNWDWDWVWGLNPKKFLLEILTQRVPVGGVNSCTGFKFREREREEFFLKVGEEKVHIEVTCLTGEPAQRVTGPFFCSN